eukprot:CAMPEP_0194105112 /NCGR_PEP_ID=MMETSP0150-20130528/5343_1 /TAXON_ID=122233 /ORGANISM="Chaetoceros debilis, Strain MM31A-1" /LENGTH=59 /DNA_ID=CAMNT_0038792843 /DNA_START=40 /DNA_END=219 /DNA_ORIENTATION=-
MTFKERLAWLGRMPTKWRVLIGGQALFFAFAIQVRLGDIEKGRKLIEAQKKLEENTTSS